jgi:hypothetical protein
MFDHIELVRIQAKDSLKNNLKYKLFYSANSFPEEAGFFIFFKKQLDRASPRRAGDGGFKCPRPHAGVIVLANPGLGF